MSYQHGRFGWDDSHTPFADQRSMSDDFREYRSAAVLITSKMLLMQLMSFLRALCDVALLYT